MEDHVRPAKLFEQSALEICGSQEGVDAWDAAMSALHKFAQKTGAPAGENVINWMNTKNDEIQQKHWAAVLGGKARPFG